jgi:hypothetical protein
MELDENLAHIVEENPEEHIGDVTKDPWDDPEQTDWPTNTETVTDEVQ